MRDTADNPPDDITDARWAPAQRLRNKERKIVGVGILLVIVMAVLDAIEDSIQNEGWQSLIIDFAYVGCMLAVLAYIWRKPPSALSHENQLLTREVTAARRDAQEWRAKAAAVLEGLGQLINQQFDEWELSKAEREIALLLLKGLSLKEIAEIRNTGEPTVRQQTASLYRKSGTGGRAELSAFFLEDLLLPDERS